MLKIAVCDDSAFFRESTKKSLLNYSFQKNLDLSVDEYEAGEDLLDAERAGQEHNLIIIDYEFEDKGKNGIEIVSQLREFNQDTKVIFLSSYSQMVFQSFEVQTFRFLIKPLEDEKLFKALDDFLETISQQRVISVKNNNEQFFLNENQITCVEGFGKNCIIHLNMDKEPIVSNETLASIEERLSEQCFYRCHRSYLVNLEHVESFSHSDIKLDSGMEVMLSRNKYKVFGEALSQYILNKQGV